jgi:hypothetical protein
MLGNLGANNDLQWYDRQRHVKERAPCSIRSGYLWIFYLDIFVFAHQEYQDIANFVAITIDFVQIVP